MRLLIISGKKALIKKFKDIKIIDRELMKFIKKRKGFSPKFIYYDDPKIVPAVQKKPKQIRKFVARVEEKLGTIDYLLILGGNDIVPFFQLKNPCDDDDDVVYSDNPYASRDDEHLIPERAVGRIPDGDDLEFFISQLSKQPTTGYKKTFGYTAKIWAKAAEAVYALIGEKKAIKRSPPTDHKKFKPVWLQKNLYNYFNLHGAADSSNWYGQAGADYPVALTPDRLVAPAGVVATEACYGAYVIDQRVRDSIALSFLKNKGVFGVCGSTTIAYGPFEPPSSEADQLVKYFFQYLKVGLDMGTALMNSKVDFAKKKVRRQGFLDSDDQKTLLQFILLGDPTLKVG